MSDQEEPSYIRALHILVGIGLVVMAITCIIFTDISVITLLLIIASAILLMGIPRLINGGTNTTLETKVRVMKVVTGFLAILLGVLSIIWVFLDPTISIEWLILLLAGALIILGFGRFFRGLRAQEYPKWFRGLILGIGLLTIIIAIVVLVIPPTDPVWNVILLSIVLLFNGIARLVIGAMGSR